MQKLNLAITIRSFNLNESIIQQLDPLFTISYVNRTGKRLGENQLIDAIKDADAVIAGTEIFSQTVIEKAPHLKIISRVGIGTDSIDLYEIQRRNIYLRTTPASTIQPVAEHTLALILNLMKKITEYTISVRKGDHAIKSSGLLQKKTIGIIGLGRIGQRVGELLNGFGCAIIFYDPYIRAAPPANWREVKTLSELVRNADIITLHTPAQEGNKPLLDQIILQECRKGVIIINTARGSLIDETALADALKAGRVAGAGLDVFSTEPYTGSLIEFSQVIATPHVASNTLESRDDMEKEAVENLIVFTKGMAE